MLLGFGGTWVAEVRTAFGDSNHESHASLEDPFQRDAALGYDPPADIAGLLRYVNHGAPHRLIRWHYPRDYELHLVVASGKFFVGDYVGNFEPGNLVSPARAYCTTGARTCHRKAFRCAICIVFNRSPVEQATLLMPELREVLPSARPCGARHRGSFGLGEISLWLFRARRGQSQCLAPRYLLRSARSAQPVQQLSVAIRLPMLQGAGRRESDGSDRPHRQSSSSEHYTEPLSMPEVAERFPSRAGFRASFSVARETHSRIS